jgi:hypothetical protein
MADIETHAGQAGVRMAQAKATSEQELCNAKLSYYHPSEAANETIPVPDEDLPFSCFHK